MRQLIVDSPASETNAKWSVQCTEFFIEYDAISEIKPISLEVGCTYLDAISGSTRCKQHRFYMLTKWKVREQDNKDEFVVPSIGSMSFASLQINEISELFVDGIGRLARPVHKLNVSYQNGFLLVDLETLCLESLPPKEDQSSKSNGVHLPESFYSFQIPIVLSAKRIAMTPNDELDPTTDSERWILQIIANFDNM